MWSHVQSFNFFTLQLHVSIDHIIGENTASCQKRPICIKCIQSLFEARGDCWDSKSFFFWKVVRSFLASPGSILFVSHQDRPLTSRKTPDMDSLLGQGSGLRYDGLWHLKRMEYGLMRNSCVLSMRASQALRTKANRLYEFVDAFAKALMARACLIMPPM